MVLLNSKYLRCRLSTRPVPKGTSKRVRSLRSHQIFEGGERSSSRRDLIWARRRTATCGGGLCAGPLVPVRPPDTREAVLFSFCSYQELYVTVTTCSRAPHFKTHSNLTTFVPVFGFTEHPTKTRQAGHGRADTGPRELRHQPCALRRSQPHPGTLDIPASKRKHHENAREATSQYLTGMPRLL